MRPRSHQLETESRAAFARALPPAWVIRDVSPDYGIDNEVEIFNEDGTPTGLVFAVQLKATDAAEPNALQIRFPHDKVEYYRSLSDPLLIVRYVSVSGTLYARWLHSFDPYYESSSVKSIVLQFTDDHKWSDQTSDQLRRDVSAFRRFRSASFALPIRVHVLTSDAMVRGRSAPEWAIAIRQTAFGLSDVIDVRGSANAQGHATLELGVDQTVASLGGVATITLHNGLDASEDDSALAQDALVALGLAFDQLGHSNLAARILHAFAPGSAMVLLPDGALVIASVFTKARRVREALDVAQRVAERDDEAAGAASNILTLPALHAAPHLTAEEREAYDRFLLQRIKTAVERGEGVGPAHYSYANQLRTSGRTRQALYRYRLAARHDPGYRSRPYFWREVGSTLFLEGRYRWAAEALRRAVELGDWPTTQALHADALMFSGEFRAAEETFDAYLTAHPPGQAEWRLKRHVLTALRDHFGDSCARDREEARLLAGVADGSADEALLTEALQLDPLCGLAWFNLGVLLFSEGRHEEAQFAFLVAALTEHWDVEAWCNAVALAFTADSVDLLSNIVEAAYRLNGDALLVHFAEVLRAQPEGPASPEILEGLSDAVSHLPPDENPFELRMVEEGSSEFAAAQFFRRPPPEGSENAHQ